VGDHLAAQVANLLALEAELNDAVGSVRDIDHRPAQGFVERCVGGSEAGDASRCSKGFEEGRAEGDANVFCCVVVVDCGNDMSEL
jgi:hypothetical protein